jgi:hypothetical protein
MKKALDGVLAHLNNNLDSTLTTIEGEESITIPRWKEMALYESKTRQYPLIEIVPDRSVSSYSSEESPFEVGWDSHIIDIFVNMVGILESDVSDNLLWYREAFYRIVKADSRFGDRFNRVRMGESDYSPMMKMDKTNMILQILTQTLIVRENL